MLIDATPEFEASLRALLPEKAFRQDTARYFQENRGRWSGHGLVVALETTDEVAAVARACHSARVPIVPYGGGTGLVGGQLVEDGVRPVVMSLERMNKVRAVHPNENVLVVEAGTVLADIQAEAAKLGKLFPLSLASEGSAQIGGLLATNAGGINTLRYGNARAMCLGLEVVRPDGSVWNGLSRLRKDNLGYDLRDLMIGSEGTLGLITAASLQMVPQPTSVGVTVMAVADPSAALDLLDLARRQVGDGVSAFELIHRQGLDFIDEVGLDVRKPLAQTPEWMVLIELGLFAGADAADALADLFGAASDAGLVSDGVIAQSEADRADFWRLREMLPEANRKIGSVSSHDISVPLGEIAGFIDQARAAVAKIGDFRINCFGHLGDGNLHFNVFPQKGRSRADHENQRDQIKRAVHDVTHALGGSVSAEHGVGRLKVDDVERYADPAKLAMMQAVKAALDPQGIMNPGVILR